MADVKERPILFNGDMVRAILEGRKTMTRRVGKRNESGRVQLGGKNWHLDDPNAIIACPFGQPGDRLWVRETFAKNDVPPVDRQHEYFIYRAELNERGATRYTATWTPSIHMPRNASRITMEITKVRVERLQAISEDDAAAEGIDREYVDGVELGWKNYLWHGHFGQYGTGNRKSDKWEYQYSTYKDGQAARCFSSLWEFINGPGSWASNPWVFVIEFMMVE